MEGEKASSKSQRERSKYGTWETANTLVWQECVCVGDGGEGGEEQMNMRTARWQVTRQGKNIKGQVTFAAYFKLYMEGNGEPSGYLKEKDDMNQSSVLQRDSYREFPPERRGCNPGRK